MKTALRMVERGLVPKPLIRRAIRRLLRERLAEQRLRYDGKREAGLAAFTQSMRESPIAMVPEVANEQHYELPPEFFHLVLGKHLKYSSGFYPNAEASLDEAEAAMLALTCERADLRDGQRVLELGCGWGSLSLWMAEHYPQSRILSVSNSAPQRGWIIEQARARGLRNLDVVTCDMNEFEPQAKFDRVVSVEMFEHMRNWEKLLGRVADWLADDARLFLHVFAHKRYAYPFDVRGDADWMSRFFFTGGMMPSHDLVDHLDTPFELDTRWEVNGEHYGRTSEDWVRNLERKRAEVMPLLEATYGEDAGIWFQRWRIFFLACAELFAFDGGHEWIVSHQRLRLSRARSGAR